MIVSRLYGLQNSAQRFLLGRLYSRAGDRAAEFDRSRPPAKVLLVVAGLIGDSVMVTPGIIAARQVWPDAHIALLGKTHNSALLSACPLIDEIHTFETDPLTIRYRAKISELKRWLAAEKFDLSMLLLGDQYGYLAAGAGIPVRVGPANDFQSACATNTFDVLEPRTWGPPERLNAFRCLGYEVEDIEPKLWVSEAATKTASEKLGEAGIADGEEYCVIHPFGSTHRQWWMLDRVRRLADEIFDEFGMRSVIVGGVETAGETMDGPAIVDTRGKLNLQELMAVIEGARLAVSTDSGPFHISGALGTRTVGLFRSRRPEHASRYSSGSVVFGRCEECVRTCEWDSCAADPCRQMVDISVDDVLSEIRRRIAGGPAGKGQA